ncbi:MAG: nuclear transport factor 2 family protein [Candidatus Calescibacterium sp.]|nr:nuclear transport factor 2 family protein [Candidatus Calescibacterium sp.]
MKFKILFAISVFIFFSCQEKPKENFEQEKSELLEFIKDYSTFLNKNSIEGLENYWNDIDEVSYIPLERDTAIIGFDNIKKYFEEQSAELTQLEFSSWNPSLWINPTKSEAVIIFLSSKNILFKNGYKLSLSPIRNSMTLTKFEGKWKIISHHESVRQK